MGFCTTATFSKSSAACSISTLSPKARGPKTVIKSSTEIMADCGRSLIPYLLLPHLSLMVQQQLPAEPYIGLEWDVMVKLSKLYQVTG